MVSNKAANGRTITRSSASINRGQMKPVLQALVLAEQIYTDGPSGKKIIAGTFNRLIVGTVKTQLEQPDGTKLPLLPGGVDPGCPMVYISLTDVIDGTELTLQMVDVSKNRPLFQTGVQINEKNRLATVEIVIPLPRLSTFVRGLGTLSFDVLWQGEILGSHRLLVESAPSDGDSSSEGGA